MRLYNNMNGCSYSESVNSVRGCCYFALVIRLYNEIVIEGEVVANLHLSSDCKCIEGEVVAILHLSSDDIIT